MSKAGTARDEEAYDMRKRGISYSEIADKLGCTAREAFEMVDRVFLERNNNGAFVGDGVFVGRTDK